MVAINQYILEGTLVARYNPGDLQDAINAMSSNAHILKIAVNGHRITIHIRKIHIANHVERVVDIDHVFNLINDILGRLT